MNAIILHTDRLMEKRQGKILLDFDALRDSKNRAVKAFSLSSPQGQNKSRFTLASRPFRPTNHNLFTSDIYADSSTPDDTSTAPSDGAVTTALTTFLDAKVTDGFIDSTKRAMALSLFNDATVQGIIPNSNLRAGLVSLVGTVGEPAIDAIVNGANSTGKRWSLVSFSASVNPNAEIAETTLTSGNRLRTLFKTDTPGESFVVLGAKLAHESMHQDTDDGVKEELYVNSVESYIYAQQLLVDPTIASQNTAIVKLDNTKLYALIESGKALFPRVGELAASILNKAAGIFSGGATPSDGHGPYTSYQDFIRRTYLARGFSDFASTSNNVVTSTYRNITADTTSTVTFNDTIITLLDAKQQIITDPGAIKLARALKLTV
jgi:hypothetical protein